MPDIAGRLLKAFFGGWPKPGALKGLGSFYARHTNTLFPCGGKIPVIEQGKPLLGCHDDRWVQCWRCGNCGYMFFDPPDRGYLNTYYQEEYAKAAASWYTVENTYASAHTSWLANLALSFATAFLGTDKVKYHESGCAFGAGVAVLKDRGYDATGCELNKDAVAQGKARGNEWISDESDIDFLHRTGRRPNVVYSNHVLEHIPELVEHLSGVRDVLDRRSIVVFAVPNAVSAVAMKKGFHGHPWFAYPGHLHLLSPRSLLCLAERAGYHLLHVETLLAAATAEDSALLTGDPAMADQMLMGAELRAVLTPVGGEIATLFGVEIEGARTKCLLSGEAERRLLKLYAQRGPSLGEAQGL